VEAGIALATLRVEDPELRSPPRRPEAVADDHHLRSLADDVPAEPDPGPSGELQPEAGRLPERLSKARREVRRLEEDEHRVGAPGEGGEAMEPVGKRRGTTVRHATTAGSSTPIIRPERPLPGTREIDEEQVDRATLDERPGHRQAVVDRIWRQDDEPFEPDASGGRLDRIEAPGEIEVGDDRAARLGLGRETQRQRRLAARQVPTNGHARTSGHAPGADDRIERGEAGPDDPAVVRSPDRERRSRCTGDFRHRQGDGGQGADYLTDLADSPRSCRTPACLQGRQGGRHVRGWSGHGLI